MNFFDSPAVKLEIRNLTTDRVFLDFPFSELVSIESSRLWLAVPADQCELDDHLLVMVSFMGSRFSATARVRTIQDFDGEHRIELMLLAYDPKDWEGLEHRLSLEQVRVQSFLDQALGVTQ